MKDFRNLKRLGFKILRGAGWTLLSLTTLLIIFICVIRIPAVQNRLTQEIITFLERKIGTKVRLEHIYVAFPKQIVLKGLYFEDQSHDTLLFAGELMIDTDLWALTQKQIELNSIKLHHCSAFVKRLTPDSTFNFDYIVKKFTGIKDTLADTGTPWEFNIESVTISETEFTLNDQFTGNDVAVKIGMLSLSMNEFNLDESIYAIESFELTDTQAEVVQRKSSPALGAKDTINTAMPILSFEDISVNNVEFQYANADGLDIQTKLKAFSIEANKINLAAHILDIDQIILKESEVIYGQKENQNQLQVAGVSSEENSSSFEIHIPWTIKINNIVWLDNNFHYDNLNVKSNPNSFDFNHLSILDLQLLAENIAIEGSTMKGNVEEFSFHEKSGLTLKSLSLDLAITNHQLDLNKLLLQWGNSYIDLNASATFPSLEQYEKATLDFELDNSTIALNDLLFWLPNLQDSLPVALPTATTFNMNSKINGSLDNLRIAQLNLKTLNNTKLSLQGNIQQVLDLNHAIIDVRLQQFYTTAEDIQLIRLDSLMPASIQLPDWIAINGTYSGTTQVSAINAIITSDVGEIDLKGKINLTELPYYDVSIATKQLNLGSILKQPDQMGKLDMQAFIKGSGLTMDTLHTSFDVSVNLFQYNQYDYKDFKLEGKLNKYLFSGQGSIHDENLDFVITGDLDYQNKIPLYKFKFDLKNANFQKLHLAERPLKARGTLDINLSTSDFQVINGNLAIRKVAIYNGESLYMVDSLLFASIDQEGESRMNIQSDIISGEFNGSFNLFSLGSVMRQHINQYFSLQDKTIAPSTSPQNFKFDLTLKNTDLITDILIPDLEPFIPGKIKGEFNSDENKLNLEIAIAQIKYVNTAADSISMHIYSDINALNYKFRLKNITQDTLTIDAVQLTGKIQQDSIYSSFQILNSKNEKKYVLGGVISSELDKFRFRFLQDQVVLNYTEWKVPADNYLDFNARGITAHNFTITGGQEKIGLITTAKDSTVSINFQNLQLSSLTRVVRGIMPANGKLNGNLKFTTSAQGNFASQLQIDQLEILEQPYGDLNLALTHAGDRYGIDLVVKNEDSNLEAKGFYQSNEITSAFDVSIKLSPLNLKLIEPLSSGQLKNIKGIAKGNFHLSGNFKKPVIRGDITFQEASLIPTYLNSTFFLTNETISFNETGISFNDFTIVDDQQNKAVLQGDILTEHYQDFRFRLRLSANNFQLLNTTAEDNKLFYGKVSINTTTRISGNANRPKLDITASLNKNSELTYVVPQAQKSVMEQRGIVQFIDKDAILDPFLADIHLEDTITSSFAGLDISANLELSDQETLNIVIDPQTGDKLSVKGNSTLTLDMTASGNMNLSGRYEIAEGAYNLSFYKLAKRKFKIDKGGTIIWSGNPLNAQLDIRARFEVETTPLDLIANQINTTNQTQLNSYRQRLPFLVLLDIKGQLLAPQITFQLDMPVEKRGAFGGAIYAKINDINSRESDVNKQVFALLILKRFVSDNPLESQGGSDVGNTTRTSVSRILSDQLNRLSENIKGVQLSLDIKSYEDYSSGKAQGDTQVQLGVSKSLLNDRLVVKLSGNVDVEGENTSQETVSDYIGDLALEYKLTSDGRFRITGFRTSNYDMIDGELIETGAGLIYIKDYNTLMELFRTNMKDK